MANTPNWALPYPALTDPADVPRWLQALAFALDTVAMDFQGTFAQRPAAGKAGRHYFATDTSELYRDNGTTWLRIPIGPTTVGTTEVQNDAITTDKIGPGAVTSPEIASGAVTSDGLGAGAVIPAKMGQMDGAAIRRGTGNIGVTQNSEVTITWDTEDYDPENLWVAASPTILTINRTGWWTINAAALTDAAAPQVSARLSIKQNGVLVARSPNGDSVDPHVVCTRRFVNADQITVTFYHNKAATVNITPSGNFPYLTAVYLGT